MEFTVVTLIKDEDDLIPFTLPSYYALKPSEVVLCFDKPAPEKTLQVTKEVVSKCNGGAITKIVEVERDPHYYFHQANLRRTGFHKATHNIILTGDIDLHVDSRIKHYLRLIDGNVGLVSFNKVGYPPSFRLALANFIAKVYKLKGKQGFTGLYAFSKKAWLETEDTEHLKRQVTRGEDTHLHHYLTKKYASRFITGLRNYCLRPKEGGQYQIMQGANAWATRKTPLWRFLLSSVLYIRPYALIGYLQARYGLLRVFKG
jgi:hypothetical protein